MATERNMSSVLAKLMCIDKPSISHATHQRHRVLPESYFQNIASVTKREKVLPLLESADFDMDVNEDLVCTTGNSFHTGRSFSPSSSISGDQKRKKSLSERNNGMLHQEKRMSSSFNSSKSPTQSSLSSQEIAKQITGQVKNSIWHSFAELPRSRPCSEKSSGNDKEERMTSFKCSLNSAKKYEASSFNTVKESTVRETQKDENQLSERWRKRKCSQEERTYGGSKSQVEVFVTSSFGRNFVPNTSDGNFSTPLYTTDGNGRSILAARYLSKHFPSAWVPRSRARHFTLDRNWSLRPGKRVIKQCNDSEEGSSTSELSSCSLDSDKPCSHQAASSILNDSVKLAKQNLCEDRFTASEFLSNNSELLDAEVPSYNEPHNTLNETRAKNLENHVSQDRTVEPLSSNCNFAPRSLETEEVADGENDKMNMCIKFARENLSGDEEPCKHQLENKSYSSEQPRSPVSSLEGPVEDCRHVEAEEHLSVSDCSENDAQGLQRKLQLIETMSLESASEGPEMVVSSVEGDDGSSVGFYQKDPQIIDMYQTLVKECWDFSYVVDVVSESGLQMRNLETDSFQDYVLDPLVFDSLEKKYGKTALWEKSERRLLFDRLNSGIIEIVKPSVGFNTWRKPVAKRFCSRQKSEEVEEVLWSLLVNQQEELKRESSDKVCRKEMEWLELEEDTDLIVQEIESLLIDELIEECVCMEISFC